MPRPRLNSSLQNPVVSSQHPTPENTGKDVIATKRIMEDATLLASALRGDQSAMVDIYDRYAPISMAIALHILGDRELAEEVTKNVFLHIWRQPADYIPSRFELSAWVSLVTRIHALAVQANGNHSMSIDDALLPTPRELLLSGSQVWRQDKLRLVVANLPKEQQDLLEFVWSKKMSSDEISEVTGVPLEAIKAGIQSALKTLQRALELHD